MTAITAHAATLRDELTRLADLRPEEPPEGFKDLAALTELIGLAEASRNLGRAGRGGAAIHAATLTRWILVGVLLRDGTRLKLRALRAGSKWLTQMQWIHEFLDAQTADRLGGEPAPPVVRTPAVRRAASDAAAAQLAAMGI